MILVAEKRVAKAALFFVLNKCLFCEGAVDTAVRNTYNAAPFLYSCRLLWQGLTLEFW
tara:strand:+ start:55 stop:228 length:174 start_codon:yes stop_codon:yes gene_type:complete